MANPNGKGKGKEITFREMRSSFKGHDTMWPIIDGISHHVKINSMLPLKTRKTVLLFNETGTDQVTGRSFAEGRIKDGSKVTIRIFSYKVDCLDSYRQIGNDSCMGEFDIYDNWVIENRSGEVHHDRKVLTDRQIVHTISCMGNNQKHDHIAAFLSLLNRQKEERDKFISDHGLALADVEQLCAKELPQSSPSPVYLPDKAPEYWAEREDELESPLDFLKRVWGKYIDAGVLYQFELDKRDHSLKEAIKSYCRNRRLDPKKYLPPPKKARTNKIIASMDAVSGPHGANDIMKAGVALRSRNTRKRTSSPAL